MPDEKPALPSGRVTITITADYASKTFMISDLVRVECLVVPRRAGSVGLETQFVAIFSRPYVTVVPITAVCGRAPSIRLARLFKSMDALQLAAGVVPGADVYLTADARSADCGDIAVVVFR